MCQKNYTFQIGFEITTSCCNILFNVSNISRIHKLYEWQYILLTNVISRPAQEHPLFRWRIRAVSLMHRRRSEDIDGTYCPSLDLSCVSNLSSATTCRMNVHGRSIIIQRPIQIWVHHRTAQCLAVTTGYRHHNFAPQQWPALVTIPFNFLHKPFTRRRWVEWLGPGSTISRVISRASFVSFASGPSTGISTPRNVPGNNDL